MPEETIDLGDNPTGSAPTNDQVEQIRSILQAQPINPALTAYGVEIERPVVLSVLDLTDAESDIISVNPYEEVAIDVLNLPTGCKRVTLRFLNGIYFGPVGVQAEAGDVIVVTEVDGGVYVTSHIRSNGTAAGLEDKANLSGGNSISGAQTLSGQIEMTGQSATNSTSSMTRGLSDTRYGRLFFARKTSNTVRSGAGGGERTADPTLAFSGLDTGTYEVEFRGIFSSSNDATGFYVAIGYGNTAFHTTSDIWVSRTRHDTGASAINRLRSTSISDVPVTNAGSGDWGGSPLYMTVVMRGTVNVVSGQTSIEVDWAQNVLDAGQTATLLSGAYLSLRKVS